MAAIITTVGSIYVARKRKKNCAVSQDISQSANIYKALNYLMENAHSDRAYILQFHNGGYYYSGRSQQKFSCTHEVVRRGISNENINSQDYRITNYYNYIQKLISDEFFILNDVEKDISDPAFSSLLKSKGVESIVNVPIQTLNGKIIGILGVDYVKEKLSKKDENRINSIQNLLKKQSYIIAGYLI
jgi:hypothetical protein